MKKLFSLLVVLILSFTYCAVLAETAEEEKPVFDYTVFKNLDGYEYDKFEDTWDYYQAYVKKFSDAKVVIGIQISGNEEGLSLPPVMYVKVLDAKGDPLYTVTAIDLIIDDAKFSYKEMLEDTSDSSVILGTNGKQVVEAFAVCKSVSIKIKMSGRSITLDLDQTQVETTLKEISKQLLKYKVWDYIDNDIASLFESLYPLTVK